MVVDGETLVDCESGDGVFDVESIGRRVDLVSQGLDQRQIGRACVRNVCEE